MTDDEVIRDILLSALQGKSGCGWKDPNGQWRATGSEPRHFVLQLPQVHWTEERHILYWRYRDAVDHLKAMRLIEGHGLSSCGHHFYLTDEGLTIANLVSSGEEVTFV